MVQNLVSYPVLTALTPPLKIQKYNSKTNIIVHRFVKMYVSVSQRWIKVFITDSSGAIPATGISTGSNRGGVAG